MKLIFKIVPLVLCTIVLTTGCGDNDSKDTPSKKDNNTAKKTISEIRFSVPSPVQTAKIIKGTNATFDETLVNSDENAAKYTTNYQQALNLGIYGADLGYLIMYENTTDAINYLSAVNTLTQELGISGAFDEVLLDKFTDGMDNLGNEDSLQKLVAEAYRSGNKYLQTNKSYDIIGLMLTGGYIESLHFATQVAKTNKDQALMNSIANQKSTLTNLIGLLADVNKEKKMDRLSSLLEKLKMLQNEFFNIGSNYTYVKSETDSETKMTVIKSKTDVNISDEQIKKISAIVAEIRIDIIN